LGRAVLKRRTDKVIFLGASNVREGFRPAEIQPLLPGYDVHNLALSASNFTQVQQVVNLAYEAFPKMERHNNIFVLGIWYGNFVDNKTRWKTGRTDIEIEKLRYNFFRENLGDQIPAVSVGGGYEAFLFAVRPFILIDRLWNINFLNWKASVKKLVYGESPSISPNEGLQHMSNTDKIRAFDFWSNYMGDGKQPAYMSEQFVELSKLVRTITSRGDRIVLVDMPIPKWHSDGSVYHHDYMLRKVECLRKIMKEPGAAYIDMSGLNDEADFYDYAHPRASTTGKWGTCLVTAMKKTMHL
jgi:hypothetical protein